MSKFKHYRVFIVLAILVVVIVLKNEIFQSHPELVVKGLSANATNVETMDQDDPALISLIRDEYLVPPAGLHQKLSLTEKMWQSPVLQVVHKLLRNKTGGYFLECGAFDGEHLSNTIELEQLNWQGVLVEADPKYKQRLLDKRRKAWIALVCLSPKPHAMKIRMVRHKTQDAIGHIPEFHPATPLYTGAYAFYEVQCFPLYSIVLAALNRTEIDYLSLDVEGAEWQIIQTIPFDKLKIKVISVEVNHGDKFMKISRYLESKGYIFQAKIDKRFIRDSVFAHESVL